MKDSNYFERLRSIENETDFDELALDVFRYQAQNNKIYSKFVNQFCEPLQVLTVREIPFLPVEFFKSRQSSDESDKIITGDEVYEKIFTSSGTTGSEESRHYVKDLTLYESVFTEIFTRTYGSPDEYIILALLPSYLERTGSSLIYMMEKLIAKSNSNRSGFYLNEHDKLLNELNLCKQEKQKTLLFGVTFALLDFVSENVIDFPGLIVMETGGMKGRRKEMIREEVHEILCNGFGVTKIHSEYGMTELLSQAYSKGDGKFNLPPWMKILIRDPYDPLNIVGNNLSGGVNVIDLANIDSCSFLATQDLGKTYDDNTFEILGRFDFSDMRGCNLMIG